MNDEYSKEDLVEHRLKKAKENFLEAKWAAKQGYSNSSINRLYYASFYAVTALLLKENIFAKTHAGVRHQFSLHFIETKKLPGEYGKFYSDLFMGRQASDYEDFFSIEIEAVENLVAGTEKFIEIIVAYIHSQPI